MNLWEKIKSGFRGSVETISDKTSEWSQLAKLRWEQQSIERSIGKSHNELGGKIYQLHVEKQQSQLTEQTKEIVQKLKTLEERLRQKQDEIKEIIEKGIDTQHLKEFRKDLELGDGTIDQLVIEENSKIIGKKLMEIKFPKNVLVGAVVREEQVIIPDGKTTFQQGDRVTLLGEKEDVEKAMEMLSR